MPAVGGGGGGNRGSLYKLLEGTDFSIRVKWVWEKWETLGKSWSENVQVEIMWANTLR